MIALATYSFDMESKTSDAPEGVRTGRALVDVDAVAAFALATNDVNPRFQEGSATPLLFTTGMVLADYHIVHAALAESVGVRDYSLSVHGQHDVSYFAPVVPGTHCRWSVVGRSALRTNGGALLTVSVRITDDSGSPLLEHLWTTFYRGGTLPAEIGNTLPDHTLDAGVKERRPVAVASVRVDRDQGFRYGGVTGDRTGHAIDDDQARAEGLPGKILQGMCTFSLAGAVLVDAVAGGDPNRVRRLAVRFSAPTRPARDLTVAAWGLGDAAAAGRRAAFGFEAEQEGATVLRHGRLEVSRAPH